MKWILLLVSILLSLINISIEDNKECNYKKVSSEKDISICNEIAADADFRCCYVSFHDDENNEVIICHSIYWDGVGYDKFYEAVKDYSAVVIQCDSSMLYIIYAVYIYLLLI